MEGQWPHCPQTPGTAPLQQNSNGCHEKALLQKQSFSSFLLGLAHNQLVRGRWTSVSEDEDGSGDDEVDHHSEREDQSEVGNVRSNEGIERLLRIFNVEGGILRFMNAVDLDE